MDREYLEHNLVAYLDGELPESERAALEAALKQHPDLMAQLQQMRKLDALAKRTDVEMPAAGYFDNLAERIDSQIARESKPQPDSLWAKLTRPWSRSVALVGSAAAVLLIAIVSYELYKPAEQNYRTPSVTMSLPPVDSSRAMTYSKKPSSPEATPDEYRSAEMPKPAPSEQTQAEPQKIKGESDQESNKIFSEAEGAGAAAPAPVVAADEMRDSEPAAKRRQENTTLSIAPPQDSLGSARASVRDLLQTDVGVVARSGELHQRALQMENLSGPRTLAQRLLLPSRVEPRGLDSLIVRYETVGDTLSALVFAYQKARDTHNIDDISAARSRIVSYLYSAKPDEQPVLEDCLDSLSRWESEPLPPDSTK